MGRLPFLVVIGALLALTSGQEVLVPKVAETVVPPITVVPNPSSSTISPPTTTTTNTTTQAPTPTTTKATTTTTLPPTKPTTPPTTAKPTPPTTAKPTPPPPTPKPPKPPANIDPPTGDWRVNYKPQNGSCIIAHMAIQLEVPYHTRENNTWHAYVDVPQNASATGACANLAENLKLSWGNNSVEFVFATQVNGTSYNVDKVLVTLYKDEQNFPGMDNSSNPISLVYADSLFNTTDKMSYKCAKIQTFNLTLDNDNTTMGYLHIGHLQLQAFGAVNTTGFADAVDCEPAGTPDIVPIAAGCALAALIIIVLAAYLIGRKRSQARGYLSMFTETKREEDYIPMKNLSCFN